MKCMRCLVVLLATVLLVSGCATYVNIPRQVGDVAAHNPDARNVLLAEVVAVRAVADDWPLTGPFAVLPVAGTDPDTHAGFAAHVGDQAVAEWGEGLPLLEVRQVYIRGGRARIDVVRTAGDDVAGEVDEVTGELIESTASRVVTAYLKCEPFSGWQTQHLRLWRIPVEVALLRSAGRGADFE